MFGYAEQTGDTAGLSAITNPSCADCQTAIATIRAAYADGGSLRGGEYVVHTVITSTHWSLDRPLYEVALDRSARSTVDRAGNSRPNLPALAFASCLLVLEWTGGRWRLLEVTSHGCVA